MKTLIVGDPHVVETELDDCQNLIDLICESIKVYQIEQVVFMGDLHDKHQIVNLLVQNFWIRAFDQILTCLKSEQKKIILIVGNHDQAGKGLEQIHALDIYGNAYNDVIVVSEPDTWGPFVMMPYYSNPELFGQDCNELFKQNSQKTLLCHQTITGAKYENGFYAPDGIDPTSIPFKRVISGHIHTEQKVAQVEYIGSPRWRNINDANVNKYLWIVDWCQNDIKSVQKILTDTHCKRIFRVEDTVAKPLEISQLPDLKHTTIIDIHGTYEYVKERDLQFRAAGYNRLRGHVIRERRVHIKESEGISKAFIKFCKAYKPKNGTPVKKLVELVNARINQ